MPDETHTAILTAVSGLGGKQPAAFLLEAGGVRILFDLGEGPEPGGRPDITGVGPVDAIVLSHAHGDHAGALDLRPRLGNPPVYATAATWAQIRGDAVPEGDRHLLPLRGEAELLGLPLRTGRDGHAPGGVWIHVGLGEGVLYTGDWTPESIVFPYDSPPAAALVVTDASYGDRDTGLDEQAGIIAQEVAAGAVLPVPAAGRGPELALRLARLGFRPKLCPVLLAEVEMLAADTTGLIDAPAREALGTLRREGLGEGAMAPTDVVIATTANAASGTAAALLAREAEGFRFVFTGHVPRGTPAARLLEAGAARWLGWNVHPRRRDTLALARDTGARAIVPAFVKPESCTALGEALGGVLRWDRRTAI
ncbi:MBL fold metallo-hydrolase [Roseomonas elaeocarpi]|uniref:MBL fold metallo-hydrolase n=1 Tax=Roseomonas elaeocarpi TaxID=907779 RepID=A0ABV6JME3_9PROT